MRSLATLFRFLKPYWLWSILAPLLMALEVSMDLMQPRLLQQIIDVGVARHDLPYVIHQGALMIACAIAGLAGGLGCGVFAVLAAQGTGADLRRATFAQVLQLSFGNLDRVETGGLITRLTNDVTQVQDAVQMLLRVMVRTPLLLVGSLVMGILTSPKLAMLFFVLIPAVLLVILWITRKLFPLFTLVQKRLDGLNTVLQENLSGIRVVKAFARAAHEIARFRVANDTLTNQNIVTARFHAVTMPLMMLIVNGGLVATLWYGGYEVVRGSLEVGRVVAFTNYLSMTLMSLMMFSMVVIGMSRAEASGRRILEVLNDVPDVAPPADPVQDFDPKGRVSFEDVSFSYEKDGADPVLSQITLEAEPGQTVAILGATGSGKTTLVNLIPRFYDADSGRVAVDGIDVRNFDGKALRTAVVTVLQESVLFSGTLKDNIRYGRPDATDEEVETAARIAQVDRFVNDLGDGYDSAVGQRGVNLSGGQKQRIAIARALVARPKILIMDDATSAVDLETESRIHRGLAEALPGCTRFVVAQRIATVAGADKIVVLDDGRIAAEGSHRDLLETSPIYREIYESQTGVGVAGA